MWIYLVSSPITSSIALQPINNAPCANQTGIDITHFIYKDKPHHTHLRPRQPGTALPIGIQLTKSANKIEKLVVKPRQLKSSLNRVS